MAIERRTLDEFCEKINIRKKELKKDRELIKKEIKNLIKVILKNLFKKKDKSID
ncbi:MAG: hypothetical protein LRZ98_02395 [Candidatus Pacebacteria bacterium]|nr:hypothetical protein [Candidatus Paceibacterota bacterium]